MSKETILPILRTLRRLRSSIRRCNNIHRLSKSLLVIHKILEDIQSPRINLSYLRNCMRCFTARRIPKLADRDFRIIDFQQAQAVIVATLPELVHAAAGEDGGCCGRVESRCIAESPWISGVGAVLGYQDGDLDVAIPGDLLICTLAFFCFSHDCNEDWSYKAVETVQAFAEILVGCEGGALLLTVSW